MSLTVAFDARKALDFGIGRYVCGLLSGLVRLAESSDGAISLVAFGSPAARERIGRSLPEAYSSLRWIDDPSPGYSLRELWSLSRVANRLGVDLFHSPHYVLPLGLRCKRVVTIHDVNHLRRPEFLRHPVGLLYADRMLRRALRAERVLVVSEATRQDLRLAFGVRGDRIRVIHNGVDDRFFTPPDTAADAAVLAGLGLEPGYFLFVGNPKPHKNLEGLLEALARSGEGVRLAIAGGGATMPGELGERVRRLGLERRVRWLGFVPDDWLPPLYRSAAALVLPSRAEGFGLPVAEAMACGTAVVVSAVAALVELVGDAGLVVEVDDTPALTAALDRLAADPPLRRRLGDAGELRTAQFRWTQTAAATWEVYEELLRPGSEASGKSLPPDPPEGGGFPHEVFAFRRRP